MFNSVRSLMLAARLVPAVGSRCWKVVGVSSAVAVVVANVLIAAASSEAVVYAARERSSMASQSALFVGAVTVANADELQFSAGSKLQDVLHATVVGSVVGGARVFRPPVESPVSDPFRLPEGPYGPGNRGIEYDTRAGEVVRAGAEGLVSFAGPVADDLYVTIDHGGGLLSSYSYLSRMSVSRDDHVAQGEVIGFAGERLMHFSVRMNGEYVDPSAFVGVRRVTVRLLPDDSYW